MQAILITGFEPFGGETINPSWEAVRLLPDEIEGYVVRKLRLPVSFLEATRKLSENVLENPPAAILCIGQAGGRAAVTPERIGINLMDTRIPDNDGYSPAEVPIDPEGPDAYFSTLPVTAMVQAIRDAGVPAQASLSAGTYVCNSLLYGALHFVAQQGLKIPTGFIHVPFLPQQVLTKSQPSLTLEQMKTALDAAVRAILAALPQDSNL